MYGWVLQGDKEGREREMGRYMYVQDLGFPTSRVPGYNILGIQTGAPIDGNSQNFIRTTTRSPEGFSDVPLNPSPNPP